MDVTETSSARIWQDEDGIIHYVSVGLASTAQTVDENLGTVRKITKGKRAPILFDARDWPRGDPASWSRFISVIESHCIAAAVLVSEESAKALGHFPEFIDNLVIPFKTFEQQEHALAFLRRHIR